jgi:hypothetical protein
MNDEDSNVTTISKPENQNAQTQLHLKLGGIPMVLVDLIIEHHNYIGIYIVSGKTDQPCGQIINATFKRMRTLPVPREFYQWVNFSLARSRNHLYVTDGSDCFSDFVMTSTNSFIICNIESDTCTIGPPLPTIRSRHVSEIVEDKLYVIGGCIGNRIHIKEVIGTATMVIFDLKTNHWLLGPQMNMIRYNHYSCDWDKHLCGCVCLCSFQFCVFLCFMLYIYSH